MLERQGGFALLVDLVHPLQTLAEAAREHGQQRLVLEGERPSLGQIDPDDEHALRDAAARSPPCRAPMRWDVSRSPSRNELSICRVSGGRSVHCAGSPTDTTRGVAVTGFRGGTVGPGR